MREIAVYFVYSLKTKQRFKSNAKCTVGVLTKLMLFLLAVRTSTVAIALRKVTMITSTHLLFNIKSCSFSVVKNDCDFLYWKNLSLVFAPEKPRDVAFILPILKRVQRWQASWRSINVFKKVGSLALYPTPNRARTWRTRRSLFVWSLPYDLFGIHGPTRSMRSLRHANCPTTIRWWPHSEQPLKFGLWVNVPSS